MNDGSQRTLKKPFRFKIASRGRPPKIAPSGVPPFSLFRSVAEGQILLPSKTIAEAFEALRYIRFCFANGR
jgi:hypothetical protein